MSVAVQAPLSAASPSTPVFPVIRQPARPKLSLNTTAMPVAMGKSTTRLCLDTLTAASPTSRNTFQNTFGVSPLAPMPPKPRLFLKVEAPTTSLQHRMPTPLRTQSVDSLTVDSNNTSTSSSAVSACSSEDDDAATTLPVPYRLPFNHNSILSNGPLSHMRKNKSRTGRPMFPAQKKVCFRAQLTEDVHTTTYTVSHYEAMQDPESAISALDLGPSQHELFKLMRGSRGCSSREPSSPQTGDKRSSDTEDSDVDETGKGSRQTTAARQSKRACF